MYGATDFIRRIPPFLSDNFAQKVHGELEGVYIKIIQGMGEELRLVSHSDLKNLKNIISKFTVPEALWAAKRKLSWLEKIANEVDDSLVFGAVVRVGREHALYDFKAVASQKVEQELIPQAGKRNQKNRRQYCFHRTTSRRIRIGRRDQP